MPNDAPPPDRRRFLLGSLAGVTTAAAGTVAGMEWHRRRASARSLDGLPTFTPSPNPPPADHPPVLAKSGVVTARRRLGRTGLDVSVVAMGAGNLPGPEIVIRGAEKGINYIDTSTCYGASEDVIGRAIKNRPDLRDRLVIATKWDPGPKTPKDRMLESLDASLRRMNVERIDVMQVHWLGGGHRGLTDDDGFNRLENPELYEAMESAKKSGKVRFFGVTSHDAKRAAILKHALSKKVFDMMLVKMNVLDFEAAGIPGLLAAARAADVGVVAMKTQPEGGLAPKGFERMKGSIVQANLRWALAQEGVSTVVLSGIGSSEATQDAAIGAAQEPFGAADRELLDRYAEALSPEYCRGCEDGCHDACPDGVEVAEVLRYRMYDVHYDWPDRARRLYHSLPVAQRWSDRCLDCDACTDACAFGVDAAGRVRDAARRLG